MPSVSDCYLLMLDKDMGFQLRMGGLPHVWALNKTDLTGGVFDPDNLAVTVAAETDDRVWTYKQVNSAPAALPSGRVLLIDVPDAEFWWLTPNTVQGLNASGGLVVGPADYSGSVLRNDWDRLKAIVELAAAWYGTTRRGLTFTVAGIIEAYKPGQFLTATTASWVRDAATIKGVITSVTFDLRAMRTTVQTSWEEPDFAAFFG